MIDFSSPASTLTKDIPSNIAQSDKPKAITSRMDVETGLRPFARPFSAARSTCRKVAAIVIIGATLSLLVIGSGTSSSRADVQGAGFTNITLDTHVQQHELSHLLVARDEAYEKRVEKGRWLFCLMNMPASQVTPQITWKEFKAIKKNGWSFSHDEWDNQADWDKVSRALN